MTILSYIFRLPGRPPRSPKGGRASRHIIMMLVIGIFSKCRHAPLGAGGREAGMASQSPEGEDPAHKVKSSIFILTL